VKYINHLNAIIAIVALVIIVQTLTKTFWQGEPEAAPTVKVRQVQPTITSAPPASRPVSAPLTPFSGRVHQAATPGGEAAGADPQVAPVGGMSNRAPGSGRILPPAGAAGVTGSQPGVVGQGPAQSGGGALGTQPFGTRRVGRTPGAQPGSSIFIPPPRTDATAKRQPSDSNPRVPPTRGSAPMQ